MRVQIELQTKTRIAIAHVAEKRLLLRVRDDMSLKLTVIDEGFSTIFPGTDVSFLAMGVRDVAKHSWAVQKAF